MPVAHLKFDLDSLIKIKLPPLPGSVLKISTLLQDINVSQRAIASAIGNDPMLASRILRLANSPIYAFQQHVTSLTNAVSAVGNKAIYEMVLIGVVADSFTREISNSAVGRDIWLHSLAVAFAAREISVMLEMQGTEESFSCGLLHDIGSLLLFRADSALFAEIIKQSERSNYSQVEREYMGFDHAEVGAAVAKKWNLPEPVYNMIFHHHSPSDAAQGLFITYLINVADRLIYTKNNGFPIEGELQFSEPVLSLGLTVPQLETIWGRVVENMREVIKTFFK